MWGTKTESASMTMQGRKGKSGLYMQQMLPDVARTGADEKLIHKICPNGARALELLSPALGIEEA